MVYQPECGYAVVSFCHNGGVGSLFRVFFISGTTTFREAQLVHLLSEGVQ